MGVKGDKITLQYLEFHVLHSLSLLSHMLSSSSYICLAVQPFHLSTLLYSLLLSYHSLTPAPYGPLSGPLQALSLPGQGSRRGSMECSAGPKQQQQVTTTNTTTSEESEFLRGCQPIALPATLQPTNRY